MTKEEWGKCFSKLCSLYQKEAKKLLDVSEVYFKNISGGVSELGEITEFEFSLILDRLKSDMVKPDYGQIPQYHQLLEIYKDEVRPRQIYDEKQLQTEIEVCYLCDGTGFVAVKDLENNVDIVFGCSCSKGESIIKNARNNKINPTNIVSYNKIRHYSRFILAEQVDKEIEILSKSYVEKKRREYFNPERVEANKLKIKKLIESIK